MAAATPPVLVINRTQDRDRLKAFLASAEAQGIQAERLPAHDAHRPDFPFALFNDLIGPHFWGSDHVKPGAIGCFLSHRAAWQTVLDRGWDAALIAEDDVALGVSTNDIADLCNEIIDIDILFANSRMADWAAASGTEEARPQLSSVLTGLSAQGGPKAAGVKPAPGADSYLITRRGAERLLAKTAALRIVCGVDWAMVWLALAHIPDQMAHAFPELAILRDHETPMPDPLICR
ncbi:MAG: glycosyltransferase family 25 protein, partial [Pseudomonadota bacterium]